MPLARSSCLNAVTLDTRELNFLSLVAKATGQRWVWGAQQTCPRVLQAVQEGSGRRDGEAWAAHLSKAVKEPAMGQWHTLMW